MYKEDVVHILSKTFFSLKRNKIVLYVEMWVGLEIVIKTKSVRKGKIS